MNIQRIICVLIAAHKIDKRSIESLNKKLEKSELDRKNAEIQNEKSEELAPAIKRKKVNLHKRPEQIALA